MNTLCQKHLKYRAVRKPKRCAACRKMWREAERHRLYVRSIWTLQNAGLLTASQSIECYERLEKKMKG